MNYEIKCHKCNKVLRQTKSMSESMERTYCKDCNADYKYRRKIVIEVCGNNLPNVQKVAASYYGINLCKDFKNGDSEKDVSVHKVITQ